MSNGHRCPDSPSERKAVPPRPSLKQGKGLEQPGKCQGTALSEVFSGAQSTQIASEGHILSLEHTQWSVEARTGQ